ncbi:MAG: signal recognition particle receptor subunit alpha [Candidatus Anstonellales archaeon]
MDLGKGLRDALKRFAGKSVIDEKAVKALIKELQRILIASDVNVKLVFELSKRIEKRALESEKLEGLTLREHVLKVVYDELVSFLGEGYEPKLSPHRILLVGLYGSGKTTTAGKIAYFYKKKGLRVALVGADVDRPAAREQLKQLAEKIGVSFYSEGKKENEIIKNALAKAKEDIIIVDSAGRSAFDDELAKELASIYKTVNPEEVYLVISADIGQVAKKQSEEFSAISPLTGVIITKMDGSGKGGGALSAVAATKAKIAFIGTGEKIDQLEVYNAKRFVSRLLGMPDIKSLVEKVEELKKEEGMEELVEEEFTIEAFYKQMKAAKKMGPLSSILGMMGMHDLPKEMVEKSQEQLKKYEAMINSMTPEERKDALLVRKSRERIERIAKGSGTKVEEVRAFLNQFNRMKTMVERFKHDRSFKKKIEKLMGGKLPI